MASHSCMTLEVLVRTLFLGVRSDTLTAVLRVVSGRERKDERETVGRCPRCLPFILPDVLSTLFNLFSTLGS